MPDLGPIKEALMKGADWPSIDSAITAFKQPPEDGGFDWKFWDEDDDQFDGYAAEIGNNATLLMDVVTTVAIGVHRLAQQLDDLQGDDAKLDAAAEIIAGLFDVRFVPEKMEQAIVKHLLVLTLNKLAG
jgi:hypothetical protein|uniref:Uncharacterized protein n=1 Tax=uncultured marine virus TaxID=186617 RepID=A0A0F7L304_9VIRU|nr:hypothetical protein [uncultured marine virus]